ncbi:MAG TPA: reverse transcriptase/maturase family protein [Candidatus Hydrogenedentes bacterium]|nr:reverse transcriptase/maturase family protein [Candidatus Hydrogenedentota bacterium]
MKRAGNLIDRIADANNLRLAFFKACRGKRGKSEVIRFAENLDTELKHLREEMIVGEVRWGGYHAFRVCDPKPRVIHAAPFRARVAHHAIINICEPVFEAYQIFDSYACRDKKGLDKALSRAIAFSRRGDWFIQMDVRKYFDTIDHDVLMKLLKKRFKDPVVLQLFHAILHTYETMPGKGIPIGNLTSQFFANHYLAVFDHYIKEILLCKRYLRYMDDFVIWHEEKNEIIGICEKIIEFLHECLELELKPVQINLCTRGMTFLGYRIFPNQARLARRSRDRFRRKASQYMQMREAGIWDDEELARHMEPLLSFVVRGASKVFRMRAIKECGLCPEAGTA